MKILASWSSGKDSAWMLHVLRQQHGDAVAGLLTTTNEAFDRVAMHAVRRELLETQAQSAGLPLHVVPLPWPCSNAEYRTPDDRRGSPRSSRRASRTWRSATCSLEDVRRYREERLLDTGLAPLFPLWKTKSTSDLAREMIDGGLEARLTCVDPRQLDASFAGRAYDSALLDALPGSVDACGENGEFHTFACAGPMFHHPIDVVVGEVVNRDGFVFADLLLSS